MRRRRTTPSLTNCRTKRREIVSETQTTTTTTTLSLAAGLASSTLDPPPNHSACQAASTDLLVRTVTSYCCRCPFRLRVILVHIILSSFSSRRRSQFLVRNPHRSSELWGSVFGLLFRYFIISHTHSLSLYYLSY